MRWQNIGFVEGFDSYNNAVTKKNMGSKQDTDVAIQCKVGWTRKNFKACSEAWVSLNISACNIGDMTLQFITSDNDGPEVRGYGEGADWYPQIRTVDSNQVLYDPGKVVSFPSNGYCNIEMHMKTGVNGRIDLWVDHKLLFSFRSPSLFNGGDITGFCFWGNNRDYDAQQYISSIIIQDTRRIGYEKFVKLNIDPSAEQNIPLGGVIPYTLGGLDNAEEYTDITSICAVLQATSRDANINTGVFSLGGSNIGSVDVSDSSGRAYVQAFSEVNNNTGEPWKVEEIQGQTMEFAVNGAE